MSTPFDTEMYALAVELIEEFGGQAVVAVATAAVYNPVTRRTERTEENHTVKISPPYPHKRKVEGTYPRLTEMMEAYAYPVGTFDYALIEEIQYRGTRYRIHEVNPINSGDDAAVLQLILKAIEVPHA